MNPAVQPAPDAQPEGPLPRDVKDAALKLAVPDHIPICRDLEGTLTDFGHSPHSYMSSGAELVYFAKDLVLVAVGRLGPEREQEFREAAETVVRFIERVASENELSGQLEAHVRLVPAEIAYDRLRTLEILPPRDPLSGDGEGILNEIYRKPALAGREISELAQAAIDRPDCSAQVQAILDYVVDSVSQLRVSLASSLVHELNRRKLDAPSSAVPHVEETLQRILAAYPDPAALSKAVSHRESLQAAWDAAAGSMGHQPENTPAVQCVLEHLTKHFGTRDIRGLEHFVVRDEPNGIAIACVQRIVDALGSSAPVEDRVALQSLSRALRSDAGALLSPYNRGEAVELGIKLWHQEALIVVRDASKTTEMKQAIESLKSLIVQEPGTSSHVRGENLIRLWNNLHAEQFPPDSPAGKALAGLIGLARHKIRNADRFVVIDTAAAVENHRQDGTMTAATTDLATMLSRRTAEEDPVHLAKMVLGSRARSAAYLLEKEFPTVMTGLSDWMRPRGIRFATQKDRFERCPGHVMDGARLTVFAAAVSEGNTKFSNAATSLGDWIRDVCNQGEVLDSFSKFRDQVTAVLGEARELERLGLLNGTDALTALSEAITNPDRAANLILSSQNLDRTMGGAGQQALHAAMAATEVEVFLSQAHRMGGTASSLAWAIQLNGIPVSSAGTIDSEVKDTHLGQSVSTLAMAVSSPRDALPLVAYHMVILDLDAQSPYPSTKKVAGEVRTLTGYLEDLYAKHDMRESLTAAVAEVKGMIALAERLDEESKALGAPLYASSRVTHVRRNDLSVADSVDWLLNTEASAPAPLREDVRSIGAFLRRLAASARLEKAWTDRVEEVRELETLSVRIPGLESLGEIRRCTAASRTRGEGAEALAEIERMELALRVEQTEQERPFQTELWDLRNALERAHRKYGLEHYVAESMAEARAVVAAGTILESGIAGLHSIGEPEYWQKNPRHLFDPLFNGSNQKAAELYELLAEAKPVQNLVVQRAIELFSEYLLNLDGRGEDLKIVLADRAARRSAQ